MKSFLTFVCTLALARSAFSVTFPNDLFYHHHPEFAVADNSNQLNNKYAQSNGYGGGYRGNYRQASPPQRYDYPRNYADGPGNTYQNDNRGPAGGNYNHMKARSYMPAQKLTYNNDGSINWAGKVADNEPQQQQQQQQQQDQPWNGNSNRNGYNNGNGNGNNNNGYYGSGGQQDQGDMPYRSSPNPNYSGNQVNKLNSAYDNQLQAHEDIPYRSSPNPNYNDNQVNRMNTRYGDQEQNGQNGPNQYYDQNTNHQPDNYGRGEHNDPYNKNDNGYPGSHADYSSNNNNNNHNQNPNGQGQSSSASATNFAGGIKLAGTLPDDGYYRGQGTFYDLETHVGTCGKQTKNSEYAVALNSEQMGEGGRSNPNCGKEVEIIGSSGKTIEATVVDSCKTCTENGLDISPAAFQELGDFSQGSIPIKWKFL